MKKRAGLIFLLLLLAVWMTPAALAAEVPETTEETLPEAEPVEIYTAQELQAIAEDPTGSYILMADLDMTGVEWKPVDFSGTFDGNGHALLNLTLSQPGGETANTYDGNCKVYDTTFVSLFGTLRGATVTGLKLINVRALVDTDVPCFLAGIAGYMEGSVISDCTVTGTLELRAHDRMFGVGGIGGYGGGSIERCQVDVTLICTDTDPATRDEEFLGGVYATGFIDVTDCQVAIDGYCSEFGYVHNGGIVGMYMRYPMGGNTYGRITGNTVTGKITFFECNSDRRAYCSAYAGETLASYYTVSDNSQDFLRDEKWVYSVELRPEMCESPSYTETLVAPGCDTYGYTSYCCDGCGYTYTDHYTPFQHTVTVWTVTAEPTEEAEGLSVGYCDGCGLEFQETVEKLEPVPTTEAPTQPTEAPPTEPAAEREPARELPGGICLLAAAAAVMAVLVPICLSRANRKGGKYLKKKGK